MRGLKPISQVFAYSSNAPAHYTKDALFGTLINHPGPHAISSVCVTDCNFNVNLLDLPFCFIYSNVSLCYIHFEITGDPYNLIGSQ